MRTYQLFRGKAVQRQKLIDCSNKETYYATRSDVLSWLGGIQVMIQEENDAVKYNGLALHS